ncbi:MAG: DUF2793 domain-containing protein [Parvularculaceae bacterium]
MTDSPLLKLPFLAAAQAQKHVTVNDTLRRLDAIIQLSAKSAVLADPPPAPAEGDRYLVASVATGAWAGQEGMIAAYQDGAWAFYAPVAGWRLYVEDEAATLAFDGAAWAAAGQIAARSPIGRAATAIRVLEEDHAVSAGATSDTTIQIPDRAVVIGVTGRVTQAITGAASWDLGVAGAANRYGNTIGIAADSIVNGVSGQPVAYFADTPLRLTANGGSFSGGVVRLAIHYIILSVPDA